MTYQNQLIILTILYVSGLIFEISDSKDVGKFDFQFNAYYFVQNYGTSRVLSSRNQAGSTLLENLNLKNPEQWYYFVSLSNGNIALAKKSLASDQTVREITFQQISMGLYLFSFISSCGESFTAIYDNGNDYGLNCGNSDGSTFYFWTFNLIPNVTAVIYQFDYDIPPEDELNLFQKEIDLLDRATIVNDSPGVLKQEFSNSITKTQSLSLSFSQSYSDTLSSFQSTTLQASVDTNFLFVKTHMSTTHTFGSTYTAQNAWNSSNSHTEIKEVTYTVKKTVEVPPYQSVNVVSFLNWVENITLTYSAKLKISSKNARNIEIKNYLQKIGFSEEYLEESDNSVTYKIYGDFHGSFGSDSYLSVSANKETKCNKKNDYNNKKKIHNKYSEDFNEILLDDQQLDDEVIEYDTTNQTQKLVGKFPDAWDITRIQPTIECYNGSDYKLIYLYDISANEFVNDMNAALFLNSDRIIFITHGYLGNNKLEWLHRMKTSLISKNSQTVCIIGWGKGANTGGGALYLSNYRQAAANSQTVGKWLADYTYAIRNFSPDIKIMGIGHSLGAHLMGKAGRSSGIFDRISGLDPAGPGFQLDIDGNTDLRLGLCDAKFVDVIHTDGHHPLSRLNIIRLLTGSKVGLYFGTLLPLGTVDFYPNFGYNQPRGHEELIRKTESHSLFDLPLWRESSSNGDIGEFISLSHKRVQDLYIWSIDNPTKFHTSTKLVNTPEVEKLVKDLENTEEYALMGYYADTYPQSNGNFFLITNAKKPWAYK